jgi:hypothetical protein
VSKAVVGRLLHPPSYAPSSLLTCRVESRHARRGQATSDGVGSRWHIMAKRPGEGEKGSIRTGMTHTSVWAIAAAAQPNRVDVLIALRPKISCVRG